MITVLPYGISSKKLESNFIHSGKATLWDAMIYLDIDATKAGLRGPTSELRSFQSSGSRI